MGLFDYRDLMPADIETLAKLADSAYADEPAPPGWRTLTGTDLNYTGSDYEGYFDGDYFITGFLALFASAARVLQNGTTLVVSFRGTDTVADYLLYTEILNSDLFLDNFSPLLEAVADYIPAAGITDIWVTGHSLGAATANQLQNVAATRYDGAFANADFVAFASPELFENADILNVGFEDDWVVKAVERETPLSSVQPNFLSSTNNLVWYDDTYASADFALPLFNPVSDTTAHRVVNYIDAVARVSASEFYGQMNRDSVVIVVDTDQQVTDKRAPTSDHFGAPAYYIGRAVADDILGGFEADTIEGFAGNDTLEGAQEDDIIRGGDGKDTAVYTSAFADYTITENDDGSFTIAQVRGSLEDGTDTVFAVERAEFTDRTIALGGTFGRSEPFAIVGDERDDVIVGGNTKDRIIGFSGNDSLDGLGGDDFLEGRSGDDSLFGRQGNDLVRAGSGNDSATGNGGADVLFGGGGEDTLKGGNGEDIVSGNAGADRLSGGRGSDALTGGGGADRIAGNQGDDRLLGEAGLDRLLGGAGDDTLDGGASRDTLTGGAGADRFVLTDPSAPDTITDFEVGTDRIVLEGALSGLDADDVTFTVSGDDVRLTTDGTLIAILEGVADAPPTVDDVLFG